MVNIIQDIIPKGRKNRPGHSMSAIFICCHDTGNESTGAGAVSHGRYLKSDAAANTPVSWHFTAGSDGIVQHLPLNESAFHAGDGANGQGNRKSIGLEICMNSDGNRSKAVLNAAELVVRLINTVPSLKPFPECMKQHYDFNGKNCPKLLRANNGKGWRDFLVTIEALLKNEEPNLLEAAIQTLADAGVITSPEYWQANCEIGRFVKGEFVASLILKAAQRLREVTRCKEIG